MIIISGYIYMLTMVYIQTFHLFLGKVQSTSLPLSLTACSVKNWPEDGRHSSHQLTREGSTVEELIPLYEWQRMSYHPGLDYCLICQCKSDVSTIETILYEYSLNFLQLGSAIYTHYLLLINGLFYYSYFINLTV